MSPRTRPVALLALVLPVLATGLTHTGPASAQDAAALISIVPATSVQDPRIAPTAGSGSTATVTVTVSSDHPVDNATLTASGDGLAVTGSPQSLGTLASPVTVSVRVAGTQPGFHQLTVQVSSTAASAKLQFPYVFTNGSPLFTPNDGLDATSYGWQGTVGGVQTVRMVSFVSKDMAYVGLPAYGVPDCSSGGAGCTPYAYNDEQEVVQVGPSIVGSFDEDFYTEGLVPPDPAKGEVFGSALIAGYATPVNPGVHMEGRYRGGSESVTFKRSGKVRLVYAKPGGGTKKLKGTFRLGQRGQIDFLSKRGKVVQRGTLLVVRRAEDAIWLVLSGRKGNRPVGNLLQAG